MNFLQIIHFGQAALAGYGGYQSFVAITNLREYQPTAEKLAAYSSEVQEQLSKTRGTQAAGAVTMLVSLATALFLAWQGASYNQVLRSWISPLILVASMMAHLYIRDYWLGKDARLTKKKKSITRVPLPKMGAYNDAILSTQHILQVLEYLEYTWVLTSVLAILGGY